MTNTKTADKYAVVEIEPILDALYTEIKDYDLYFFDYGERDNNHCTTFHASMVMTKIKRSGHVITFSSGRCDFRILDSISKIEKQLTDDSCGIENASYSYTVHFTGSNVPLEFGVGKKLYVHPEEEVR